MFIPHSLLQTNNYGYPILVLNYSMWRTIIRAIIYLAVASAIPVFANEVSDGIYVVLAIGLVAVIISGVYSGGSGDIGRKNNK